MADKLEIGNVVSMIAFATVVRTGSFSAAAEELNCSKAAVSRQVARLEQSIGAKLLTRTTRQIALTAAGHEIFSRCTRIVDEVNEANRLMGGMLTSPRGELKVNAPVVTTLFRITSMIPLFLKQYPDVRIHLNLSDSRVDLLNSGFDVTFWLGEPYDTSLDAVKLRSFEMVICGSPEYFKTHKKPLDPSDLKHHACIMETHLFRPGEWRIADKETVKVSRGPLTCNSVRTSHDAALAGIGLAFLPRFIATEDISKGRLIPVLTDRVSARLPMYLLFPKTHYQLAKVRAFIDFMSANVTDDRPLEKTASAKNSKKDPARRKTVPA
jgi:DNA-binding transcriptional LysR family regulator